MAALYVLPFPAPFLEPVLDHFLDHFLAMPLYILSELF